MGKSKISIIIAREFSTRVKKKSFILITLLAPVLLALIMVVPSLIMIYGGDGTDARAVAVADKSGIVLPYLIDSEEVTYTTILPEDVEGVKANLDSLDFYAVVDIAPLDSAKNTSVAIFSKKQVNMDFKSVIRNSVEDAVKENKINSYTTIDLATIMKDVKPIVKVETFQISEDGGEKVSMSEISMGLGYILSFLIYMFIFMFGSMVMQSVMEEKSSRVIEVIVSSVKPFELLMGKILGVASVALLQFTIWIVLTCSIVFGVFAVTGVNTMASSATAQTEQVMQMVQSAGVSDEQLDNIKSQVPMAQMPGAEKELPSEFVEVLQAVKNVNFTGIIGCFIIYFILGYLLYSSLFAAVGGAVENQADTQQLMVPITMPLMIGLFIMMHTFQHPDSSLSFWASIIPFTSPMVMMARISYGVPAWELALSIGLLVATFIGIAFLSAKIYRIGILMYGKKPGWKDLYKWLKY